MEILARTYVKFQKSDAPAGGSGLQEKVPFGLNHTKGKVPLCF